MSRGEAWLQHVANLLVGGTGLLYAWTVYLAEPEDPYAVVNHPWQPALRSAHVVAAPLLVFAIGLLWRAHIWERLRAGFRPRRRSGLALALLALPMIASGYLLQVAVAEVWRNVWIVTHVAGSVAWIAVYAAHQLAPRPGRTG